MWILNDWETRAAEPIYDRDLWEGLLKEMYQHDQEGQRVLFWLLPGLFNREAERAARWAAEYRPFPCVQR